MKVKSGYKQTEVGVIPEAWEVKPLGNLIKLQAGYSFRSENFSDIGMPVIRISDIQDGIVSTESAVCHPPFKIDDDFVINNGDYLVAMSGATTGKVGVFHSPKPAYQNQRVGRFVVRDVCRTSQMFVGQLVRSSRFGSRLSILLEQGAQPNVSGRQIESLLFPIPNQLLEQRAIAETLSDVDGLLVGLNRLIAKKRDIKQATMQLLLTGKTRLPGFSGAWEQTQMRDLITRLKKTSRLSASGKDEGIYPFFTNTTKPVERFLDESDFETEAIIANTGGEAYFNYYKGRFAAMSDCLVFESKVDTRFLYYLLKLSEHNINSNGFTGSGIKHLDKKYFEQIEVCYPVQAQEQTAIANVLTDMDAELSALEARRDKARALKQGMMQELLTGKTRLI